MGEVATVLSVLAVFVAVSVGLGLGVGLALVALLTVLRIAGIETGFWEKP